MWIAKPISTLSTEERRVWHEIEVQLPLAQSLSWAQAAEVVSGQCFLVFSPDERVGGIVFCASNLMNLGMKFECINGPFLHWDHPHDVTRQLATFAMAVSKLNPKFISLSMKPRWEEDQYEGRLKHLPFPVFSESQAATLEIPICETEVQQWGCLSHRIKRTLSYAKKEGIETQWEKLSMDVLPSFVKNLTQFGSHKGFTVPPLSWFQSFTQSQLIGSQHLSFWLSSAVKKRSSLFLEEPVLESKILICFMGHRAHYLFGYEKRDSVCQARLSTSAAAHWEAINQSRKNGIQVYDLNGYLVNAPVSHSYYGVCKFKEQFSGQVVQYKIPEILIQ